MYVHRMHAWFHAESPEKPTCCKISDKLDNLLNFGCRPTATLILNPNWHIQSCAVTTPPCMPRASQGLAHNAWTSGSKASERCRVEKGDQAANHQTKLRGELVVPKALR